MLGLILFGLVAIAFLFVVAFVIFRIGTNQRSQRTVEMQLFASKNNMLFDSTERKSTEFLHGFNLLKWGYGNLVRDIFQFGLGNSAVTIGEFRYRYGKSGGSITFFLVKDGSLNLKKQHYIEPRGLFFSWFQKSTSWTALLPKQTRKLIFNLHWEFETFEDKILIYQFNYLITDLAILKNRIEVLESLMPDVIAAASHERK